ncbi:HbrB-like-domain-containing protein [Pseudomassariella vexata]|uniref:HbrB-like-domain-containing protein n=1 Tax=Pseudomassariella vexata TaxID=1141098 RepID=A0A1Y2DGX8_9PEZI|nr:HbrB-like-domain-containing protein [Pseudomassariella vexata]ORY58523.1 HbrB-like-domain-containing protein [Pseudomassariella vexata]
MQPARSQQRAPGSFSPLPGSAANSISSQAAAAAASGFAERLDRRDRERAPTPTLGLNTGRPQIRRIDTSSSDDTTHTSQLSVSKTRSPRTPVNLVSPPYGGSFTAHPNTSSSSLNFSRPTRSNNERTASPLTVPPNRPGGGHHSRKHSQTQGLFEPTLPSTSTSNLTQLSMGDRSPSGLSASQIAAQAAMHGMHHQQHNRHRSQTVPFPGSESQDPTKRLGSRPGSRPGHSALSPPMLSLTEASVPREGGFGYQGYHNGLSGNHSAAAAAAAAANVAFPRSPQSSPGLPSQEQQSPYPPSLSVPEKPAKAEKSKVKLFSRPKKIDIKGETKEKPLPSPGKIGSALASLQRGNYSTASLVDNQSMYSLANSSSATIRPTDTPAEKEVKEKEKKHHFLSRQKHKLSSKDDYHLPLSSAASNSRPVDPYAPSSLYNFNLPPSPGPNSTAFGKSVSGLDLRHGGRALREKRKEDKLGMTHDNESVFTVNNSEWPGPNSLTQTTSNPTFFGPWEPLDGTKYGLNNMTLDDAWPYLKAKLLVIFEGEDLRLPVEDFNRVVAMHIQYCVQRRSAHIIIEDLRELLGTGFASLDHTLRKTPEDRLIPALVELWIFTFTSILPYMQAVFLPLDLEFAGNGTLSPEQAREFWGGVLANSPASGAYLNGHSFEPTVSPAGTILDIRRLVLLAYRDAMILPRYDKLKTIFSRLSLEHLPSSLATLALASPPPINDGVISTSPRDSDPYTSATNIPSSVNRPGTAMSLDPSVASYNSSSSTLLNEGSNPSRSRAISNVSYGSATSDHSSGLLRPFTPQTAREGGFSSGRDILGSVREQNVEDSKQVTDMVGRMLQCMSVLASVGSSGLDPSTSALSSTGGGGSLSTVSTGNSSADEGARMVSELGRLLKLNWLGRGRTGRNRRGIVGGRVRREDSGQTGLGIAGMGNTVLREGVGAAG